MIFFKIFILKKLINKKNKIKIKSNNAIKWNNFFKKIKNQNKIIKILNFKNKIKLIYKIKNNQIKNK